MKKNMANVIETGFFWGLYQDTTSVIINGESNGQEDGQLHENYYSGFRV